MAEMHRKVPTKTGGGTFTPKGRDTKPGVSGSATLILNSFLVSEKNDFIQFNETEDTEQQNLNKLSNEQVIEKYYGKDSLKIKLS